MKNEETIDFNNYILTPTKRFRIRRVFGRYIMEKELAVYNLWGPGLQKSTPFMFVWNELTDEDVKELGINEDTKFQMI